ncbi:hypothetical protein D3C77_634380 [compost metagenome]
MYISVRAMLNFDLRFIDPFAYRYNYQLKIINKRAMKLSTVMTISNSADRLTTNAIFIN